MADEQTAAPDSTAVRVALWRAMHVQVDPPPHVLEDEIGLRLAAPDAGWRQRPDMDPQGTPGYRAPLAAPAPTSSPARGSSRIWSAITWVGASPNTFCSARAWIPSRSADRTPPPACESSRSTSPGLRPGSASA